MTKSSGKRVFSHEEAFPELGALALGGLSAAEVDGITEHVSQCSICSAELAVMYDAAASLATATEAGTKPLEAARAASMREVLLARARLDAAARASEARAASMKGVTAGPPPAGKSAVTDATRVKPIDAAGSETVRKQISYAPLFGWALAAAVILAIVTWRQVQSAAGLRAANAQLFARADSLEAALASANRMIVSLAGKEVRVVDLVASGIAAPSARMFWDVATDSWNFFAHDMPQLATGRTYQLWLVTAAGPVDAGTFTPAQTGAAIVHLSRQVDPNALRAVAVTEEPAGGSPQPTSTPIIIGNAK